MKQLMLLCILFLFSCSDDRDNTPYFEVWLGSDGHEYQRHAESHVSNQWIHYVGCKKCI